MVLPPSERLSPRGMRADTGATGVARIRVVREELTVRQHEVARLLAQGLARNEIAAHLAN